MYRADCCLHGLSHFQTIVQHLNRSLIYGLANCTFDRSRRLSNGIVHRDKAGTSSRRRRYSRQGDTGCVFDRRFGTCGQSCQEHHRKVALSFRRVTRLGFCPASTPKRRETSIGCGFKPASAPSMTFGSATGESFGGRDAICHHWKGPSCFGGFVQRAILGKEAKCPAGAGFEKSDQ